MSVDLESRFVGTLLGCAIGDALGAPFEGLGQEELSVIPGVGEDFAPTGRRLPRLPRGYYTDDTQLTIALTETYVACGKFDGDDFGQRVGRLWRTGEIIGAGGACTFAAENLLLGESWENAGAPPGQAGNGTAMRASPVGLFRWNQPELLRQESLDQSRVTHQDRRAGAGAAAVAFTVAWNLAQKPLDPEPFCQELAEFISPVHAEFARYLFALPFALEMPKEEAIFQLTFAGWEVPAQPEARIPAFVIPTVLVSLYIFLQYAEDFPTAVKEVIRLGGDVDTTGAITGALVGSRVGEEGIPQKLRQGVRDGEKIRELARALYRRSQTAQ